MTEMRIPRTPSSLRDVLGDGRIRSESGRYPSSLRSFRLLFELGRGGMARVYLAESVGSGIQKLVVLKILNHELARDVAMRAAFLREAVISGRMNHPNVVQVHEVLEHHSTDVIVMEYVDGFALSRIVQEKQRQLGVRLHLSIVVQMLAGLHYFHELTDLEGRALLGVHRDVSPHNVLVSHDGQVKVADFGIAKINAPIQHATQAGLVKGKIHYMAPEQLLGEEVDRRADIFSAGVMFWEALTERRFWLGRSLRDIMDALSRGALPDLAQAAPGAPPALIDVARRATAVRAEERYATALEMLDAAERALSATIGIAPQRELSEFMSRAFGEIRAIQGQSVNDALRHPDVAPLGVLDCWTAGHVVQRSASLRREAEPSLRREAEPSLRREAEPTPDTSAALVNDLTGDHLYDHQSISTGGALNASLSGLTASGPTVLESTRPPKAARRSKAVLVALGAVALILGVAAWLMPRSPAREAPSSAQSSGVPSTAGSAEAPPPGEVTRDEEEWASANSKRGELTVDPAPVGVDFDSEPIIDTEPARRVEPRRVSRSGMPAARPAAGTARSAPRPNSNCSPPYRLLPSGVKSFKPECFSNGTRVPPH